MTRRRAWILACIIAVIVAAGAAAAWSILRPPSIEDAAHSYLHALSKGDMGAIERMMPQKPAPEATRTLERAFASASGYIADPRIEGSIGDDGSVRASATLGGHAVTILFVLAHAGQGYVLSGDYLAAVTVVPTLGVAARIGDAPVRADVSIPLLPALYRIQPAPAELLVGGREVPVTNASPMRIELDASPAPDIAARAGAQLQAYEDACTHAADTVPPNCGLRVPWAADLRNLEGLSYRIERRPQLVVSSDARSFAATGGIVIATARGTGWDGTAVAVTYRDGQWSLRGDVIFTADTMRLAVR